MKYRKKPVEIVAHRIGEDGWPDEIWEGVVNNEILLYLTKAASKVYGHVEIRTREGVMRGDVGDWIIKGSLASSIPSSPTSSR